MEVSDLSARHRHRTPVYIIRQTRTPDGGGGFKKALDEAGKTRWRASIQPISARDVTAAGRHEVALTNVINIDPDPPGGVERDCVIRRISDGKEFIVAQVRESTRGLIRLNTYERQRGS